VENNQGTKRRRRKREKLDLVPNFVRGFFFIFFVFPHIEMNYRWICHSRLFFFNDWNDSSLHLPSIGDYNIPARNIQSRQKQKPILKTTCPKSTQVGRKKVNPSIVTTVSGADSSRGNTGGRKRERKIPIF
jgi:hypothetical protein